MDYFTVRNEEHQELRLSMSEYSERYIELKDKGFRVTNRNSLMNSREKYERHALFLSVMNPKSLEVEEKYRMRGWAKGES